jgi:ADP-ribosyl-[dinitrogen reductase] hydrolase
LSDYTVAAIAAQLLSRVGAGTSAGALREREDLEPAVVTALGSEYPGRVEKDRKVDVPGWANVGRADVIVRRSPASIEIGAVVELKWCYSGHDVVFETVWDAVKLALCAHRDDRPAAYLLCGAPFATWERSQFADLFEDGPHQIEELLSRSLSDTDRSLVWDALLAGGYDHYPLRAPASFVTARCGRARLDDWELRAAEVTPVGTKMLPLTGGWPQGRRPPQARRPEITTRDRFLGCLLAGAVGDALGAPIEFLSLKQIHEQHGPVGVTGMTTGVWPAGTITDDTQMTLFTAEGLLRRDMRGHSRGVYPSISVVTNAYSRWACTQGVEPKQTVSGQEWEGFAPDGWLVQVPELHVRRAPGSTCLTSLMAGREGSLEERLNDSKGCGGVMRAAPAGLMPIPWGDPTLDETFRRGEAIAAITHGHPSGFLAAGFLALLVERLRLGDSLDASLDHATERLEQEPDHDEVSNAVLAARRLASTGSGIGQHIAAIGSGWIAEEALAIAVYAVAATRSLSEALLLAVNHGGDSDSTGAIAGNIAGALYGIAYIPNEWLEALELKDVVQQIADDLYRLTEMADYDDADDANWDYRREAERYPGW